MIVISVFLVEIGAAVLLVQEVALEEADLPDLIQPPDSVVVVDMEVETRKVFLENRLENRTGTWQLYQDLKNTFTRNILLFQIDQRLVKLYMVAFTRYTFSYYQSLDGSRTVQSFEGNHNERSWNTQTNYEF